MGAVQPGARHTRRPLRLLVQLGIVDCPMREAVPISACLECEFLQGTLEGPDRAVLCAVRTGRPAVRRSASALAGRGRAPATIFESDWPDD